MLERMLILMLRLLLLLLLPVPERVESDGVNQAS